MIKMGKKAKLKKIRRLASQMPVINTPQIVRDRIISGKELITEGVKKVGDNEVQADKSYIRKKVVQVPINHNRKMKRLYNQYGVSGVGAYVQAVNSYINSQKEKQAG